MNINRILWIMTTFVFAVIGGVTGWYGGRAYAIAQTGSNQLMRDVIIWTIAIGSAIVMARVGSWLADRLLAGLGRVHQMSAADRVLGIVGMLLGLLFGTLVTLALPNSGAWIPVKLFIMAGSAATGMALLQGMRDEMLRAFPVLEEPAANSGLGCLPKFMDTNVIIDGRITELCRTGWLEGPIYVPCFVLDELQYIADSADSMRRARGRRGLDTLNEMHAIMVPSLDPKGEPTALVQVLNEVSHEVKRVETVDGKLVALARETGGAILTNDFNLNRVAEVQGVRVLNINALALALKPVVLPGEEMQILLVREGKEPGQGIGYLDDGTMVVVAEGRSSIGETCRVTISQVIQTVAGKMILPNCATKNPEKKKPSRRAAQEKTSSMIRTLTAPHTTEPATISVIVPAAGCGARAALNGNKVLAPLLGRPLLWWTLRALATTLDLQSSTRAARLHEIVIAARRDEHASIQQIFTSTSVSSPLRLVEGGATRAASVLNAVQSATGDYVLVHDAARPLLSRAVMERVVEAALQHGAAIAALPADDTVKQVVSGTAKIAKTLDRQCIWLAQTPQMFRREILLTAMQAAQSSGFQGTDCASYVEHWCDEQRQSEPGENNRVLDAVQVVRGEARNFKVTYAEDVTRAEEWLRRDNLITHQSEIQHAPSS
jgi:2-C-methyl-D-erythritol 4-phosphate cytidylyltransferase